MNCSKCSEKAVYHRKWEGSYYCKAHFTESFERRFLKEIRENKLVQRGDKIAVGISGGKDSSTLLHLLGKFKEKLGIEVIALSIDEGIEGYRPETLKAASRLCEQLGVKHNIASYKEEIGIPLDALPEKLKSDKINWCSWCGVWRRWCLNRAAKRLGATKLAVGHNLDDEAQSVLMNFMRGDWQHLVGEKSSQNFEDFSGKGGLPSFEEAPEMQPASAIGGSEHRGTDAIATSFIPRIKPLRGTAEKETTLYAVLQGLPFSGAECPHSFDMLRHKVGTMINDIELESPGTKLQIVATSDKLRSVIKDERKAASACGACGEAAAGELCRACELKAELKI
jgi:uncharacterized protein (TIGR00269 family)